MKLTIAAAGKLKAGPERDLYERYAGRIDQAGKGVGLGPLTTLEISESRKKSAPERKAEEAAQLLARLDDDRLLVVLDETGDALTSKAFAQYLQKKRVGGAGSMAFVLGGPDGHGEDMRANADRILSLGPMTLAHGLARVVLAEQIYRAVTILTGHPYHRA